MPCREQKTVKKLEAARLKAVTQSLALKAQVEEQQGSLAAAAAVRTAELAEAKAEVRLPHSPTLRPHTTRPARR